MNGHGRRLRKRTRELGISNAEIARRMEIAPTRCGYYAHDRHEPDLATFARICAVLGASPSDLLGLGMAAMDAATGLRHRLVAATKALDEEALRVLAIVADGLVARAKRPPPPKRPKRSIEEA